MESRDVILEELRTINLNTLTEFELLQIERILKPKNREREMI